MIELRYKYETVPEQRLILTNDQDGELLTTTVGELWHQLYDEMGTYPFMKIVCENSDWSNVIFDGEYLEHSLHKMFYDIDVTTTIDLRYSEIRDIYDMSYTFAMNDVEYWVGYHIYMDSWDVSKVTNMEGLFENSGIVPHFANFVTSSVTNFKNAFRNTTFLFTDIDSAGFSAVDNVHVTTENATDVSRMFCESEFFEPADPSYSESLVGLPTGITVSLNSAVTAECMFTGTLCQELDLSATTTLENLRDCRYMFSLFDHETYDDPWRFISHVYVSPSFLDWTEDAYDGIDSTHMFYKCYAIPNWDKNLDQYSDHIDDLRAAHVSLETETEQPFGYFELKPSYLYYKHVGDTMYISDLEWDGDLLDGPIAQYVTEQTKIVEFKNSNNAKIVAFNNKEEAHTLFNNLNVDTLIMNMVLIKHLVSMDNIFGNCRARKIVWKDIRVKASDGVRFLFQNTDCDIIDLGTLDGTGIKSYRGMFQDCKAKYIYGVIKSTNETISYKQMFDGCSNALLLPTWRLESMKCMCFARMFAGCSSIKNIYLPWFTEIWRSSPEFDTYYEFNIANRNEMFYDCSSLERIWVSKYHHNWSIPYRDRWKEMSIHVDQSENMFGGCTSLVHLDSPNKLYMLNIFNARAYDDEPYDKYDWNWEQQKVGLFDIIDRDSDWHSILLWSKSDDDIWERSVGYIHDSEDWSDMSIIRYNKHTEHREDDDEVFPGPEDWETLGKWFRDNRYTNPDISEW